MAVRKVEDVIERLGALRNAPESEAVPALAKALGDKVNLVVAKAAAISAERGFRTLVPNLLGAFDRLFEHGAQRDPQCWAKLAIARALVAFDRRESPPYLRGLRHVQMEPVWGGQADTAINLRGTCVLALAACADIPREETLRAMVDALADPAGLVRAEAVRALAQMPGDEGALLLRLKARVGDEELQVSGQVFDGLLALEGEGAVAFVAAFLKDANSAVCPEAALSLGSSRLAGAVDTLIAWREESRDPELRQAALQALAVSRQERALDYLLDLVLDGATRDARAAIEALSVHRESQEIRRRVEAATAGREPEVRAALNW